MSALIAFPVILFSISGYILFPAIRFRIPFNRAPLIGFSCLFIALYFFALFGVGQAGIIFAVICNLGLLAASIFLLIKKRSENPISEILIPAILFFSLMLFFAFFLRNRIYNQWDELSFWDAFVRSLYVTGAKSPTIIHADYPLSISLIQYYFVGLTKYSHGIIIFGIFSVIFSGILYCCPPFSGKTCVDYPVIFFFAILALYFCESAIDTIYIDGLIGIFFAALIFKIFSEEEFNNSFFIQLAILLFFFVSLKTSCIVLLCVLLLVLVSSDGFIVHKDFSAERGHFRTLSVRKTQVIQTGIVIAGSATATLSWEIRNQIIQPMKVFSTSRLTLENIRILFSADIAEWERKIWELVLDHLFRLDFFSAKTTVFMLVSLLFFIGLLIHIIENSDFSRKFLTLNTVLFLGFGIYTAFLTIFAMFVQEPGLGEQLNSFHRYIGSYLIAWGVSFFAILIQRIVMLPSGSSRKFISLISAAIFFYVLSASPMERIFSPLNPEKSIWLQQKAVYQEFVNVIPSGSTVQVIDLDSSGLSCQILNNLFVGHSYMIWEPCSNPEDFQLSKAEFADYIEASGADYILILHGNDYFWKEFSEMFDYPWHGQAFKVAGHGDYRRVSPAQ